MIVFSFKDQLSSGLAQQYGRVIHTCRSPFLFFPMLDHLKLCFAHLGSEEDGKLE